MDNLGDHMVWQAINRMLAPLVAVDYAPSRRIALAARLARHGRLFRLACLGGGTLIFGDIHRGWGAALQHALPRTASAFSFGTGVIDPTFRDELHRRFGYTPLRPESTALWVECLARFALVSVRGRESERILRGQGLGNVEVVGDPSFYFARDRVAPKPRARRIGLNVTDRSYFYGDAGRKVVEPFAALIRLLRAEGWQVTLFPMSPEDLPVTHALLEQVGSQGLRVCLRYHAIRELLDSIAEQDVFVGVRLHSVTAALCTYTPAIMIGYQPKNFELMESVGMLEHYLRVDALDPEELFGRIEDLYGSIPLVQARQFAACQAIRGRLLAFRDRVHALAGAPTQAKRRPRAGTAAT